MSTKADLELIETAFGPIYARRGDFVNRQLREFGAHQRSDLAMLLNFVRKDDTVVDVGAHIGTFSLPISSVVGDTGRVYAFEAVPGSFEILEKNIKLNRKEGIIFPVLAVLSDDDAEYDVSIDNYHSSAAHFFRAKGNRKAPMLSQSLDMWHEQQKEIINPIKIVKIDTEGMELNVLRGSQNILREYKPILFLEISVKHLQRQQHEVHELEEFLLQFGYHFFKNLRGRNARNDGFRVGRLWKLNHGGAFYDLLAVHPHDSRYPVDCIGGLGALAVTLSGMLGVTTRRALTVLNPARRNSRGIRVV